MIVVGTSPEEERRVVETARALTAAPVAIPLVVATSLPEVVRSPIDKLLEQINGGQALISAVNKRT